MYIVGGVEQTILSRMRHDEKSVKRMFRKNNLVQYWLEPAQFA
jgi:hypothetical protein